LTSREVASQRSTEEGGGRIFKGIQDIFPDHKTINRTYINTWEDERVVLQP
jgi:hypothetical protein